MRKHVSFVKIAAVVAVVAVVSVAMTSCLMPWQKKEIAFEGKNYSLVFNDDFNYFNQLKWGKCFNQKRQDAGGWWKTKCNKVEDGNLVITSSIDKDGTPISGGIQSRRIHARTYGLYHMRFKADKADGLWDAFWLLSDRMNDST